MYSQFSIPNRSIRRLFSQLTRLISVMVNVFNVTLWICMFSSKRVHFYNKSSIPSTIHPQYISSRKSNYFQQPPKPYPITILDIALEPTIAQNRTFRDIYSSCSFSPISVWTKVGTFNVVHLKLN